MVLNKYNKVAYILCINEVTHMQIGVRAPSDLVGGLLFHIVTKMVAGSDKFSPNQT